MSFLNLFRPKQKSKSDLQVVGVCGNNLVISVPLGWGEVRWPDLLEPLAQVRERFTHHYGRVEHAVDRMVKPRMVSFSQKYGEDVVFIADYAWLPLPEVFRNGAWEYLVPPAEYTTKELLVSARWPDFTSPSEQGAA